MIDRYFSTKEAAYRLVRDFYKHNNIIIAVDFDNTIYNFMSRGYSISVIELLRKIAGKWHGTSEIYPRKVDSRFTIVLFTAREDEKLIEAIKVCEHDLNIRIDYVNESPTVIPFKTRKPFYNILLDDKAGLGQAYKVLIKFLKIIDYEYIRQRF